MSDEGATPLRVLTIDLPRGAVALREPLSVAPDFSDGLVTFEHASLDIVAYARTRAEAEQAFGDELAWLWEEYAEADDADLSPEARLLKQRLRGLVEDEATHRA